MKDTVKMVAAIVIFAVVACSGLAIVYEKTKPVIENNQKQILTDALSGLFPVLNNGANEDVIAGGLKSNIDGVTLGDTYKIVQNGQVLGVAVTGVSGGFQDNITALVGIDTEGKITGVKVLQIADTPGLGANAAKATYFVDKPNKITFYGQFAGKSAADNLAVTKDGGNIAAITASTITSRAVTKLVKSAADAGSGWLAQNAQRGTN
ncbi:electron transport complex subunit G [Spirochaetia bacterium]|nr:electron transport complex subunit G [Spirochaetia bacterium]